MSYILDALKKSEKERTRGTVPDVLTVQEPISHDRKRRNILLSLIALALLVNAAILIWWLGFSPEKKKTRAEQDASPEITSRARIAIPENLAPSRNNAIAPERYETEALRGATQPSVNSRLREAQPSKAPAESHKKDIPQKTGQEGQSYTFTSTQLGAADSRSSQIQKGIPNPEPGKIYVIGELPEAIRKELPPLSLNIALYSDDPSTRIARIDGQSLREGQEIVPGLRLEQIIEHGAIISYRNYRFRIGMK